MYWYLQERTQSATGIDVGTGGFRGGVGAPKDRVGKGLHTAPRSRLWPAEGHFNDDGAWMVKLTHYISGVTDAIAQKAGLHADYGFIVLLSQDQVGGLEARPHIKGEWPSEVPIPGHSS